MVRSVIFCLTLWGMTVYGQDPYAIEYSIDEGLPTSNIYSVYEDNNGYIWFGTDVGVLRYDGYEFRHFSTDDGLSDNEVFQIFEDSEYRLWFLTLNGQLSYFKEGRFINTKNNELLRDASHPKMVVDAFEHGGLLYILFRDGYILTLDLANDRYEKTNLGSAIFGHWIIDDRIYLLSLDAVIGLQDGESYSFAEQMNSSTNYRMIKHMARNIFAIDKRVFEFNGEDFDLIYETEEEVIHANSFDDKLWLGTRSGFEVIEESGETSYFKSLVASFVLKDSQNNFWLTSLNDGIRFISNFDIRQYNFSESPIKVNAVRNGLGSLWVGTEKGLYREVISEGKVGSFTAVNSDYVKRIRNFDDQVISVNNMSVNIITPDSSRIYDFGANDFYFDGRYYYFSSSVAFRFLPKDLGLFPVLRFERGLNFEGLNRRTLFRKRTNVISPFRDRSLLFGGTTGLYIHTPDSLYQLNPASNELYTSIQDLYYNEGTDELFVATNSRGLSILKADSIRYNFSKRNGLSSNSCHAIRPLGSEYFIATNRGVDRISFSDMEVRIENMNTQWGLPNEKVNDIELVDSMIYLATGKGLLSLNYYHKAKPESKPRLIIEDISINGQKVSDLSELDHDQNNLRVEFIGLSYVDHGEIDYEYRLNDSEWTSINTRSLDIKNLPPGTHNFELRAKGRSNIWSDVQTLEMTVAKPFWKTIPFLAVVSLMASLLVYFIVGRRIKSMQAAFSRERTLLKEKEERIMLEKHMTELEQKALRMQMNPHFVFNALNTIKGFYSSGEVKEANKYISKFSKLLRLILENDQRHIALSKEIEIIELYMELIKLRYVDVFSSEVNLDPDINPDEVAIPTLILQPLVENAIIHGLAPKDEPGKLIIGFSKEGKKIKCTVADNGVGLNHNGKQNLNGKHKSMALQITRERIALENGTDQDENFMIRNRNGEPGTEVILKFPELKEW